MPMATQAFEFPKSYTYPPMWDMQRVLATRQRQFKRWSGIIQAYCRHNSIWRLTLVEVVDSPLFSNQVLRKSLSLQEAQEIIDWMTGEEGLRRAQWVNNEKGAAWIYWKRPEEWAEIITNWIDETGQKNTVLTLYELTQGEATLTQGFHGMDLDVLQQTIQVLVRRGKAQIFGSQDEQGVKFF